jgi:UDP-2,3-diacylglucosamine hydrolase
VKNGILTRRAPTSAEQNDIQFGWDLAKEMGRLDVGQSICVRDRATMAVEAIEGTDLCIERAGQLCRGGSFTVIKVAKPKQDMRFDVPTIGLRTLETMTTAGARCLAIESGKTILLDQDQAVRYADQHGIAIVSLTAEGVLPVTTCSVTEPSHLSNGA